MSIENEIFETLANAKSILLFRHARPDGDCVGATMGLREIFRKTWPNKPVYALANDESEAISFLGKADEAVSEEIFRSSVGVVVDTADEKRVSSERFRLCGTLIKIDHHIEREPFGDLRLVQENRSSLCELLADFCVRFENRLVITPFAATCLYTGMVTDSGRFRFEGVTGKTLRLAAFLLEKGVNTEWLYANLYAVKPKILKFRAFVYENLRFTENGVCFARVNRETQERFGLSFEQACACIQDLENIEGALIWIAFIEDTLETDTYRARIRSRFVESVSIAEAFHGGGHAFASGATARGAEEITRLLEMADKRLQAYKAENRDYL